MRTQRRRLLAGAAIGVILLAACGATVSETFGEVGEHLGHESEAIHPSGHPSDHPSTPPGADGSIEIIGDAAAGGSGVSIEEAIEVSSTQPVLVNGIILRDADGTLWFCERVADSSPPECDSPKLVILNFPSEPDLFDPAVAETAGATTRDGITWLEGHQIFGVVHPPG